MTLQFKEILKGEAANDDSGDPLRTAAIKINENFDKIKEVFASLGVGGDALENVVYTNDPRLSDRREAVHPSGRHEDNYYALRQGSNINEFRARYYRSSLGVGIGGTTDSPYILHGFDKPDNFSALYPDNKISYWMTNSLPLQKQALVLPENVDKTPNNPLMDLVVLDAENSLDKNWKSIFRILHDGSLQINNKTVIDSSGKITQSALSQLVDGAPSDMDTLRELAEKIQNTTDKGRYLSYQQTTESEEWNVVHSKLSLNAKLERVTDEDGVEHIPASFRIVNESKIILEFTTPIKGSVLISFFSL